MRRDRQIKHRPHHDPEPLPAGNARVSRARLIQRWRHGSDSFFWRMEADGLLLPVRRGRSVFYRLRDVFAFEGGQPPEGWDAAYRVDLMLPEEVGVQVSRCRDWVLDRANAGELPCRRAGAQVRFVPAEVTLWLENWA
jgi:hypothetical protein